MLSYDQAVVMLAALAASADGQPADAEQRAIQRHLAPVLKRLGDDGLAQTIGLLRELLAGIGPDNTLSMLRNAMVTPQDRLAAVRLAVQVAYADGTVDRREVEHVADLAINLGLDEDEFRSVLPGAGRAAKAPVVRSFDEPIANGPRTPDEAILMLAVLTGSSDGVPQEEESRLIESRLALQLGRLGPQGRQEALARLTDLVNGAGFDGALESIRQALPGHHERVEAVRIAARVVLADRKVTRHERAHVERVAATMGVAPADVSALLR